MLLFVADKRKAKASKDSNGETSSGGKVETTPPTGAVPQSKVKVERPPMEDVLRYPIEVFVSAGEPFIPPESMYNFIHTRLSDSWTLID